VLADVLTHEHILGNFAYGRGDVCYALPQPRVGLIHLVHVVQPAQVYPTGFFDEGAAQCGW
jgi:hypothetical protein